MDVLEVLEVHEGVHEGCAAHRAARAARAGRAGRAAYMKAVLLTVLLIVLMMSASSVLCWSVGRCAAIMVERARPSPRSCTTNTSRAR